MKRPTTHTAYAVVYKRDSHDFDSEAVKGFIHSIHTHVRVARHVQDKRWHVVKKITFQL